MGHIGLDGHWVLEHVRDCLRKETCFLDQIVCCDDTPESKVQMSMRRREPASLFTRHARRLSYEWLAGPREIVIDPERCPPIFSEFTLKKLERDKEGNGSMTSRTATTTRCGALCTYVLRG